MGRVALLVSDVDNTLLGSETGLAQFVDWHRRHKESVCIAYNSGRFVDSIRESIESTDLPEPDALIGGVGTQICLAPEFRPLSGWPLRQAKWDADVVRRSALELPQLESQPDHLQSPFKVSFYGYDLEESLIASLRDKLSQQGIECDLVYSSQRDLDILPRGVNKGSAAMRLATHLDIPRDQVCVAGDSGNDLPMFVEGFKGILVANAHTDLITGAQGATYSAQQSFAAGVVEGLEYWMQ